jgi:hypothetical protein
MAQFIWLGEPPRSYVKTYGPTLKLKVPKKDGTHTTLTKPAPGFPVDQVVTDSEDDPVDFTDERSLRVLRADTRFQEVV